MEAIFYIAAAVLAAVFLVAMQPRTAKQPRPSLEDFAIPRANQGDPIPWVFGEVVITGATVTWYGDLVVETETENGVKTRKFYIGLHFVPCYGPVDALTAIYAGERTVWTGDVTDSTTITISQGSLFGGKRLQGGIEGDVDVMMGDSTQTPNGYLTNVQGTPQPAYRGLLSLVANQIYISANVTQIEPWAFRIRRIINDWYGGTCWYQETAEIAASGEILNLGTDAYVHAVFSDYVYSPEAPFPSNTALITTTEGDAGGPIYVADPLSGTNPYKLNGDYVSASGRLICRIFQNGSEGMTAQGFGLALNAETMDLHYSDSRGTYASQFFPTRIGYLEIAFRWTDYANASTNPSRYPPLLFCGNAGNYQSVDATNYTSWSWALFLVRGTTYDAGGGATPWTFVGNATLAFWYIDSGGSLHTISGTTELLIDTDYTAQVVFTASTISIYVNGELDVSVTTADTFQQVGSPSGPNTSFIIVGQFTNNGGYEAKFGGEIDYVDIVPGHLPQTVDSGYMNPAHIIYQALTDPRGMGEPVSRVDDYSFREAAYTFYTEGLGLCMQWLRQEAIEDFIQHVCDHAACVLRANPTTGKWDLKPIRADYEPSSLTVYDEDDIVSVDSWERVGYGELVGEVTVTYRDVATNKDAAVTMQNLAVIQAQSGVVNESLNLPGIPTEALANRICMRELRARSVPLARVKLKAKRSMWELLPGDVFKLSWDKLGLTEVIMRVVAIDTGTLTDGMITVEATEDVYGMPSSTYAASQASGWSDPTAIETGDTGQSVIRAWENATQRRTEENQVRMTE